MSGLHRPLAVVALSCKLPGAADEKAFWSLLEQGASAVTEMPPHRLNREIIYEPEPGHVAKTYSTKAGLVPEQAFSAEQLAQWDPCHLIFLSQAQEAWNSVKAVDTDRVGVYVGHSGGSQAAGECVFSEQIEEALAGFGPEFSSLVPKLRQGRPQRNERGPKLEARMAAKLVAETLGLTGPAMVIDAACASSLVAIAIASLALDKGDIDCALVGGASYAKADSLVLFSQARSCSANGSCPFDQSADGLVGSEGYVCLVIKNLERAISDGDQIRAVIRGIGLATDGRGRSLWAPRKEGQILALERAYQGLDPGRIQYVEAHATSTQVGDATEIEALTEFFSPHLNSRKLALGSVKSNLGHTLETAGVASLTKVILAMEHGKIPASINIEQLNAEIPWGRLPVEVLRDSRSWNGQGLVGVSAFGIGGLNVHLVLESYNAEMAAMIQPVDGNSDEEIVIVGRGVVLDGVGNIGILGYGSVPEKRISGYHFDGLRLRIPPRLVERGDPLGFMLLDAAGQALEGKAYEAAKTAVVVATSFGNRFTDELQMGLHLPEIETALGQRWPDSEVSEFRNEFLKSFPAVLDETGGFTASSLASRIAKAYNLMGGALALDSGPQSSCDALRIASQLLRAGGSQSVLCCSGERSWAFPAEGAAALLLKTRSRAASDGDKIWGVVPQNPQDLFGAPGPFGTAQGILELLHSTISRERSLFRLGAATEERLQEGLEKGLNTGFSVDDKYRVAAVASDPGKLNEKLKMASKNLGQRRLLEDQGVYCVAVAERRPRVAFCFAGQGSQYQGMLKSLVADLPEYHDAEATLKRLGLPSFASMAWSGDSALDEDPVTTQVSLLVADTLMFAELTRRGLRADCLVGHSFGEFAALVAAESLTLEQALRLTHLRARALAQTPAGGLVSVQVSAEKLEGLLQGHDLYITHYNSPEQTVLGGSQEAIRIFQSVLEEHHLNYRSLKVPGALHTSLVATAQVPLMQALDEETLLPPSRLFLSNVTNSYTTETSEIKANLVKQLVKPVRYTALIKKLVADGAGVLVEVGPSRTLTSLHRQILGDTPVILCSTDHPRRGPEEQLDRLSLLLEALDKSVKSGSELQTVVKPTPIVPIEAFDATTNRKSKRKAPVVTLAPVAPQASEAHRGLERFVLDFVVDLTGYPLDVIDLDWDLEADLGLDSIKRTQLFGELIDLVDESDAQALIQANFRSLREILDWLQQVAPVAIAPEASEAPFDNAELQAGVELGRQHRDLLRKWLRDRVVKVVPKAGSPKPEVLDSKLLGIARGAGVHPGNLAAHKKDKFPWERSVTSRHVMRMTRAPLPINGSVKPKLVGAALVVGRGPVADALCETLDVPVFRANSVQDLISITGPVPHLFLASAVEAEATTKLELWPQRRARLMEVYWLCQEWFRRLKEQGLERNASVVATTNLGGDFGLSGQIEAAEGGAICGLLKALQIEFWVAGHRSVTLRVVDSPAKDSARDIVKRVLAELSVSRLEIETGWLNGKRHILKAFKEPVAKGTRVPSGTWICTGGGRGITAHVVQELVKNYGIKVHILGRAPFPDIKPEWRAHWPEARSELKVMIMEQARLDGREPVTAWRDAEKALEIEGTLNAVPGATYHCVDVFDKSALAEVLQTIRDQDVPITGVLHGAGASRDARFDQKSENWVEQCVRAKIDGTAALMHLTWDDPIDHFVAFGSISGRFGANGHTDYSMSNDMMAKLVDWYRVRRPGVAAVTFHWHAWGDVGMATRPETELGLQMIAMQFMPASEGVEHLCRELEAGAPEPEILITDDRYHRLFTPSEPIPDEVPPMLQQARPDGDGWTMELNPAIEVFLNDHRLHGKPVLPLVVALEIMAEVAQTSGQLSSPLAFAQVKAYEALTFYNGAPRTLRVSLEPDGFLRVRADMVTRDGRLVQEGRLICEGISEVGARLDVAPCTVPEDAWQEVSYEHDLGFYHGPSLRALQAWQVVDNILLGKIVAPALSELLPADRSSAGWLLPSATLDACLYAVGVLAAVKYGCGSAPESVGLLEFAGLPNPGENCLVRVEPQGRKYNFTVFGEDGMPLIRALDYTVSLLSAEVRMISK